MIVGVGQTARTLKWRMPQNEWGRGYAAVCTYTDATTQSRKDSQFRLNGGGRRLSGEKKRERVGRPGAGARHNSTRTAALTTSGEQLLHYRLLLKTLSFLPNC